MGDRAQVRFVDSEKNEVWFYTHWDGYRLEEIVKSALKRGKERWDDDCYLARIIFSEMIKDSVMDIGGYGIDFEQHGDVSDDQVITVICSSQMIELFNGARLPFEKFAGSK